MLSVEQCRQILNEESLPDVEYTLEEAEWLRSVLYTIACIHLESPTPKTDAEEASHHLLPRLYNRAS